MFVSELSETSRNKLLEINFELTDPINEVAFGHGDAFSFFCDAPIHYAAREGDLSLLKDLLEHGADLNLLCGTYYWTPVMWATHYGRKEAVAYLVEKGADLTIKAHKATYPNGINGEEVLVECNYDVKDMAAGTAPRPATHFGPFTFFWTQYQKLALGKEVDYSGTKALIDEQTSTCSNS